jgi:cell wall-associated NlpC family hydrolase
MEGVIRVPLAPVRFEPSDRAEMVTQALFGELLDLELVEGQPNWAKVHLHFDGYQGFIDPKLVDTSEEAVEAFESDCLQLTTPLTAFEWAGRTLNLPAGSRIPRAAFPDHDPAPLSDVLAAAMQFLGAPYLWPEPSAAWTSPGMRANNGLIQKTTVPVGTNCSMVTSCSSTRKGRTR